MTINEYFDIIQDKIKNRDFTVLEITNKPPTETSVFLEAINYMMWEWCDDHNDPRTDIFEYILVPNGVDYDFTTLSFKDFIKFLSETKSKEIIKINMEEWF